MRTLVPLDVTAINAIITSQDVLKQSQAQIRDDIKALAERLETKPARVNAIIRLVRKEAAEPGSLEFEQDTLDAAEKVAR
jgi:hypothetical protein